MASSALSLSCSLSSSDEKYQELLALMVTESDCDGTVRSPGFADIEQLIKTSTDFAPNNL